MNVVAIDPRRSGVVLAGGDVSGIHRSTDWGRSWSVSDEGLSTLGELKIAAIAFSPLSPDTVYAAAGVKGADGGILRSDDGGQTWSVIARAPQFSGGKNKGGLPTPHPRSTGNLLAVDPQIGGLVYAATFDDGVMRSADGGVTWDVLGLQGSHLRSLALDPTDPDVLYAATFGGGLYRTASARTTGALVRIAAAPTTVEELVVVGSDLYAAAGSAGLTRSPDGGETWVPLDPGVTGAVWTAIAGGDGAAGRVLYAGTSTPGRAGTARVSVVRSDDGGASWTSLTSGSSLVHHDQVGGPGGEPWWLAAASPDSMLGGRTYVAAQLVLDPADPEKVFLAGRAGVWGSDDAGRNWYPRVRHLQVTTNRAVAIDPTTPGRAYAASSDWKVLCSRDGLVRAAQCLSQRGVEGYALALDHSTTPARVYAAVGAAETNTKGEIYSSPDPAAGAPWKAEGLTKKAGGRRALGIAVGHEPGSSVILAAVEGSGVWRKAGGVWTRVNSVAMVGRQTIGAASFSWSPGSPTVYLYDNASGVWRSNDRGRTWTRIWARSTPPDTAGHVVADPVNPSRLYVAVPRDGLYVLEGATQGSVGAGISPREIGSFSAPGPIAFGPGPALFATESAGPASTPALLRSTDGGATWEDHTSATYRAAARFPLSLAVDPTGAVVVGLRGTGALVGVPAG